MKLEELVGTHLMIGVAGDRLTGAMIEQFRSTGAAGLIAFRPNFASGRAFLALVGGLEEALGRRLLVAVDHEGGRVIHLTEGVTVFPDNLALGMSGKEAYARRQGHIEARELARLGIDLNLAPSLDVLTDTYSAIIGIRSYGRDPDLVARLGAARIRASQAEGLWNCAKHFPGLGHSPKDPHRDLPVLETPRAELERVHLPPFRAAIKAGVRAVMTTHAAYPRIDPSGLISTFSKKIVRGLLRRDLGFSGLVLSDDLEMGASSKLCAVGEAACRAVEAGHDMVLLCHKARAQRAAHRALLGSYRSGRLPRKGLAESAARIQALLHRDRSRGGPPRAEKKGEELARAIARQAVRAQSPRLRLGPEPVCVVFPRLSELAGRISIEEDFLDEAAAVGRMLGRRGIRAAEIVIVGLDPSQREIERALEAAQNAASTLFFCYDAHASRAERRLLASLERATRRCTVVLLRNPYDEAFVKRAPCLKAFGFRRAQIEAVFDALLRSPQVRSSARSKLAISSNRVCSAPPLTNL